MPDPTPTAEEKVPLAHRMQRYVEALQARVCEAFEALETETAAGAEQEAAAFRIDPWERAAGGGGRSAVLEGGALFEKAGVNTSAVHGRLPERMARVLDVEAAPFFATGWSLIVHPRSPHVPTVHANVRYFALGEDLARPEDEWFGGGADLTPYYPRLEDARHFHRVWKAACEAHPAVADYAAFKKQCDEYFYLPHREEARGVGGIFYDYLRGDAEAAFAFSRAVGDAFLDAYRPLVERRRGEPYGARARRWQELRRGRYVEFNLLYDRGTKFGLETEGRTESILMSLPPEVRWGYDAAPRPGTPEEEALRFFQPRDWLAPDADTVFS